MTTKLNALLADLGSVDIETPELVSRLRALDAELDRAKALYAERDAVTLELATRLGPGEHADALPDGTVLVLTDQYATANVAWTSAPVRRFVAELTDRVTLEKRRARRTKRDAKEASES